MYSASVQAEVYFKGLVQQRLGAGTDGGLEGLGTGVGAGAGGRARGGSGESGGGGGGNGGNRARGGSGESARARGGSGGKAAGGGGGVRLVGPEDLEGIRQDGRMRQAAIDAGMNVDR